MMVLIASIAIGDGFNCIHHNWQILCCLLLLAKNAPSSDAHIAFAAARFTSLLN
jgi:hypothetical protein